MAHEKIEKTLEKIKHSFIQLIVKKGFSELNVSDIATHASINRGTFYNHYKDKYDLLDCLESNIIEHLKAIMEKGFPYALHSLKQQEADGMTFEIALETATLLYDEKQLIVALLSDNGDGSFLNKIRECFASHLSSLLFQSNAKELYHFEVPLPYVEELIFQNIVTILTFWLTTDQKETPQEIAKILTSINVRLPLYKKTM